MPGNSTKRLEIKLVPVTSSHIKAIGYHPPTMTLRVQYKRGVQYDFVGVQPMQHELLMAAPSQGVFMKAHIEPKIKGVQVQEDEEDDEDDDGDD